MWRRWPTPVRSRAASGVMPPAPRASRVEGLAGPRAPRAASSLVHRRRRQAFTVSAGRPLLARYQPTCLRALRRPSCAPWCASMSSTCADGDRALLRERRRCRGRARSPGRRRCAPASTARRRRRGPPSRRRHRRPASAALALCGSTMSPLTTTGMPHGLLDAAHEGPVGRALEELAARAGVDGDELPRRRPRRGARAPGALRLASSQPMPHLERHGHVDGADHGLDQAQRRGRDRASSAEPDSLPVTSRAGQPMLMSMMSAPRLFRHARPFCHPARLAARQLYDERSKIPANCAFARAVAVAGPGARSPPSPW